VQYFWAGIAADLLDSPEGVGELERPATGDLPALFKVQTDRLLAAITTHPPEAECWSWYEDGHSIGWVRRRQAHEALIHRVDAELAIGSASVVSAPIAADGIDEILTTMLDASNLPEWASFDPNGQTAVLTTGDHRVARGVELGSFSGTSPNSGIRYDDPALRLLADPAPEPTAVISGAAADLDLWLWGRKAIEALEVSGSSEVPAAIRAAAASATQ